MFRLDNAETSLKLTQPFKPINSNSFSLDIGFIFDKFSQKLNSKCFKLFNLDNELTSINLLHERKSKISKLFNFEISLRSSSSLQE